MSLFGIQPSRRLSTTNLIDQGYRQGAIPEQEVEVVVPRARRYYRLSGMPADAEYAFTVAAIRNVDPDVDPSGRISTTPRQAENRSYQPAQVPNITADIWGRPASEVAASVALIGNIASDSVIAASEKPDLILERNRVQAEYIALETQADTFGLSNTVGTPRYALNAAHVALTAYLVTIPGWNTLGTDTLIDRQAFNSAWSAYYNAVTEAQTSLANYASQVANWGDLQGSVPTNVDNSQVAYVPRNTYDFQAGIENWGSVRASLAWTATSIDGLFPGIMYMGDQTADPYLVSPLVNFAGNRNYIIRSRFRCVDNAIPWKGTVYYTTGGHSYTGAYSKTVPEPAGWSTGQWCIVEWDMRTLTAGGTDWLTNTINYFRIDFSATPTGVEIDYISYGDISGDALKARGVEDNATLGATWGTNIDGPNLPADNAGTTTNLLMFNAGEYAIIGNTVKKVWSPTWRGAFYTSESFVGTAFIQGYLDHNHGFLGLSADQPLLTPNAYANFDYAIYNDGLTYWIYLNNATTNTGVATSNSHMLTVTYDGVNVRFYADATLLHTQAAAAGLRLYGLGQLRYVDDTISRIQFGPYTDNAWATIGGSGRPQDNATYTNNAGVWVGGTPYLVGDFVQYNGASWFNNVAHTSNALYPPGHVSNTQFTVMADKGLNSVTAYLTNESVTVATNDDGTGGVYTNAGGTFKMFNGDLDVTTGNSITYSIVSQTSGLGLTINSTTGLYAISGPTVDTGEATLRATYNTIAYDKVYSFAKSKAGVAGQNSITGYLTNEDHTIAAATDGTGYNLTGSGGTFKLLNGASDVTGTGTVYGITGGTDGGASWTKVQNGLTLTLNETTGVYSLSGASWTSDTETFTMTGVLGGATVTKVYSISKSKAGGAGGTGASAKMIFLASTHQTFTYAGSATVPNAQTTTVTATRQNTAVATTWETYKADGTTLVALNASYITTSGDTATITHTQFDAFCDAQATSGMVVVGKFTDGTTFTDRISIVKVQDGATGAASTVPGPGGPVIALTSDAQAFRFIDNVETPGSQSITLTAIKQNTGETVNWTTSPSVTLTGTGDSRTLSSANFGANRQVTITATGATTGVKDTMTIVRLDQSTAEAGADLTYHIPEPSVSRVFKYDAAGSAEAGEFSRTFPMRMFNQAGTNVGAYWEYKILAGVVNGIGVPDVWHAIGTETTFNFPVSSLGSSFNSVEIRGRMGGAGAYKYASRVLDLRKEVASPQGGVLVSKTSGFTGFSNNSQTDVTGQPSATLYAGKTAANITVALNVNPIAGATGNWTVNCTVQYYNGSWIDVYTAPQQGTLWNSGDGSGTGASFYFTATHSGLTPGTLYYWRAIMWLSTGTRTHNVTGEFTVTA